MGVNEFIQIGTRIKRIRMDKKLSQKSVAEKLGIPHSTYSNYENNNREPSYETLKHIAKILNVSIPYLLYGDSGIIEVDTANYLLTLAGFDLKNNGDETYTLSEIENGEVKLQTIVSVYDLKEIVSQTSDYVIYLTQKLFRSTPPTTK